MMSLYSRIKIAISPWETAGTFVRTPKDTNVISDRQSAESHWISPWLAVICLVLAGCKVSIQHALDEREANEIVSVLTAHGIDAQKLPEKGKKPTWAVEVPDDSGSDALRILTELKLPRPHRTTTRDVAQPSGLIETPSSEKLRQMEALEGDLEQTIETMDGVVSAGVELVVPSAARPGAPVSASKASAFVRVQKASYERIQQQREQLRSLISGSVEGLKLDDVTLMVDAVEEHAPLVPPGLSIASKLRAAIYVLSTLLVIVAGLLIVTTLRLRKARAQPGIRRSLTPRPIPVVQSLQKAA